MDKELLRILKIEQESEFRGFDFSHLKNRMDDEPLEWSYVSSVIKAIREMESAVMVDMGTGGGEILSRMQPLPKNTFATESYAPNIKIARERLEPLGIKVIPTRSEDELPFADNYFDIVANRHTAFESEEVFRVLKKGGVFITQQVGGNNGLDLMDLLGTREGWKGEEDSLKAEISALECSHMNVIKAAEAFPRSRVFDTGALVYYLKAIPWAIPDFSIEKYDEALTRIDEIIRRTGYVEFRNHRTFIIAKKL